MNDCKDLCESLPSDFIAVSTDQALVTQKTDQDVEVEGDYPKAGQTLECQSQA